MKNPFRMSRLLVRCPECFGGKLHLEATRSSIETMGPCELCHSSGRLSQRDFIAWVTTRTPSQIENANRVLEWF